MSDIVERLRAVYSTHPMVMEAADEIERLKATVNGMIEKGMDELTLVAAFQVNEELRAEGERLRLRVKFLEDELKCPSAAPKP